jgi:hypothetical protein
MAGWAWLQRKVPFIEEMFARRTPYRSLPVDDDGEFRKMGSADDQ